MNGMVKVKTTEVITEVVVKHKVKTATAVEYMEVKTKTATMKINSSIVGKSNEYKNPM